MNSQINYHPVGEALQDIAYEYDLVGNITAIHDRSSKCGVADNLPLGEDALDRLFHYDPLYRLVSATGRECRDIPHSRPWLDEPRCGFNAGHAGVPNQDNAPHLTALYREDYAYDPAGNLVMLQHQQAVRSNGGLSWETIETRRFGMGGLTPEQWQEAWPQHLSGDWHDSPGNRLTHLEDRWAGVASPLTVPQAHFYDDNGNLIRENQSRHFEWDFADRLRSFRTQAGDSEPSIHAHYLYDAAGQRVKKLVRKQGGQLAVTVYIDGLFEYQRLVQGSTNYENNTLHVMDDQSRIATVRVGEPFPDDTAPAVKYHLGDHLGSSNLVINSSGKWVNREEYTPYGETSFGSFARKRYRFSGKERDEESGLYYHGLRYYAPWLGRWTAQDPAGFVDGINRYIYARDNPLMLADWSGKQSHIMEMEVNLVNKQTGKLETVEKSKELILPEEVIESDPQMYTIPASDGWPEMDVLPGIVSYTGRTAHLEQTESGRNKVVMDPTDTELMDQAMGGMAEVLGNWVDMRSLLGMGTGVTRWVESRFSARRFATSQAMGSTTGMAGSAIEKGGSAVNSQALEVLPSGKFDVRAAISGKGPVRSAMSISIEDQRLFYFAKKGEAGISIKGRGTTEYNVPVPDLSKALLETTSQPNKKGKLITRVFDAEAKNLELLIQSFPNPEVRGTVYIGSSHPWCASCQGALTQAKFWLPNVRFIVVNPYLGLW